MTYPLVTELDTSVEARLLWYQAECKAQNGKIDGLIHDKHRLASRAEAAEEVVDDYKFQLRAAAILVTLLIAVIIAIAMNGGGRAL